jgi:HEAT repeat protein
MKWTSSRSWLWAAFCCPGVVLLFAILPGCASQKLPALQDLKNMEAEGDIEGLVQALTFVAPEGSSHASWEKKVFSQASAALVRFGASAVPHLLQAMIEAPESVLGRVASTLAQIRPRGVKALLRWAKVNDWIEIKGIARALGQTDDEQAMVLLAQALSKSLVSAPNRAARMAKAIGQIGGPRAVDSLRNAWEQSENPVLRAAVLEGLGVIGSAEAIDLAVVALGAPEEKVRRTAAEALAKMGNNGVGVLVRLYLSKRPNQAALGEYGLLAAGPAAALPLVQKIGRFPKATPEELARVAAKVGLQSTGRARVGAKDWVVKILSLLAKGLPETAHGAAQGLGHPAPSVRSAAAVTLGLLQAPEGIPYLGAVLANDKNAGVRGNAAVALGLICDDMGEMVALCHGRREIGLAEDIYSPGELERRLSSQARGRLLECNAPTMMAACRDPALPALARAATDESPFVRQAVARALVLMALGGSLRADLSLRETLEVLVDDEDKNVKATAREGLMGLSGVQD